MTARLVLTMIVRNESTVIERCLRAARPHIDGYVIVDTGSLDDTVLKIRSALADLPGLIKPDPWVNFGVNRSRSASLAREWVETREWDRDRTYLLFLDADMIFHAPGDLRERLTAAHYRIPQRDGTLHYYNTRIVRLSHRWRAVGVTHEYWAASPDAAPEEKDFAWIEDRGDGGSRGDKTERDIALLEGGLRDEPENERYMFYLAQSLYDARRFQEAIAWYRRRIAAGGWEEEVWYAAYKLGLANWELGEQYRAYAEQLYPALAALARFMTGGAAILPPETLSPSPSEAAPGLLQEAYQRRPWRPEPLVALARLYRTQGKNHLAYMNACPARDLPFPADDRLFVDEVMSRRGALEEIAITAFYLGKHEEGRTACETLLAARAHPAWFHDHIARCASFYVKPIADQAVRSGQFEVPDAIRSAPGPFWGAETPNQTTYNPSNPTIVRLADGRLVANVRLVNYYHERGRVFAPKDADGIVRTRNVIQEWDPETGLARSSIESSAALPAEWDLTTRVRGLEDQRWAQHDGRLWLTFTCFNIPGSGGQPQVALGRVTEQLDGVEAIRALRYAGSGPYEKNWLPWSRPSSAGRLALVYGYDPFRILEVDPETGECVVVSETRPSFATARWRGSAGPVPTPIPGRYVGVIHETAWFGSPTDPPRDQRTVYMHRFFECTETDLTRRSGLFTLDHAGVEYVAGLARSGGEGAASRYVLTHSVEEASAHWKEFSWETIDRLLGA